jgi:hypothetical protein
MKTIGTISWPRKKDPKAGLSIVNQAVSLRMVTNGVLTLTPRTSITCRLLTTTEVYKVKLTTGLK